MGSHQELLAQRGLYWKLYELQYKDQEDRDQGTGIRDQLGFADPSTLPVSAD